MKFLQVKISTIWITALFIVVAILVSLLPYDPSFPYALQKLPEYGERWLTTWAQFDGVHYLTIIEQGYVGTGLIQAFFPLYPLLVKILSINSLLNPVVVGVMLSIASFLISTLLLSKLFGKKSTLFLLLLLSFPTSFFFFSLYTESLFFLLVLSCFYYIERKRLLWAGVFGLLASLTRLSGVFLFFPLLHAAYVRKISSWYVSLLPIVGLIMYMTYLAYEFGDPLMFYSVQSDFGAKRATGEIIFLPQIMYRYMRMFMTVDIWSRLFYTVSQEFFLSIGAFATLLWGYRKIPLGWWMFSFASLTLPTLTGTLSSMPRYVLVVFPLFWIASKLNSKLYWSLIVVFCILQLANLLLFIQGYWVA